MTLGGTYTLAAANVLSINNPGLSENGAKIDVIVTNSGCSVTSNFVVITVNAKPVITVQPVTPDPVCSGTSVTTLNVTASGSVTYQWRKNSGTILTNTWYL